MSTIRVLGTILVVVGLLAASVTGPGVAARDSVPSSAVAQTSNETVETSNETTATPSPRPVSRSVEPHVDPDTAYAEGSLGSIERLLADQLSSRLEAGSLALSRGNAERAREALGPEYSGLLSRYVDVVDETGSDDRTPKLFQSTRRTQLEYVRSVESYRETRQEYLDVKSEGRQGEANQLARELDQAERGVARHATNLTAQYDQLSTLAHTDLTVASTEVNTVATQINETQSAIRSSELTRTQLTVWTRERRASFERPLALRGSVRTVAGEPLADRNLTLVVNGRPLPTRTDAEGRFTAAYRPVTLPLDAERVVVRYRPMNTSPYLGSQVTVPLEVRQSTALVTVESNVTRAGFGDPVNFSGRVTVGDVPVSTAPVAVRVGGRVVGTAVTNTTGVYQLSAAIPATARPGNATTTATLPLEDRAVVGSNPGTPFTVTRTRTALSLTVVKENGTVELTGRLTTVDGRAISDQPIVVGTNGTALRTVTTDATGQYSTSFNATPGSGDVLMQRLADLPPRILFRVSFAGEGTNLEPTSTTTAVVLEGGLGSGGGLGIGLPFEGPRSPQEAIRDGSAWLSSLSDEQLFWPLVFFLTGAVGGTLVVVQSPVGIGGRTLGTAGGSGSGAPGSSSGTGGASGVAEARRRLERTLDSDEASAVDREQAIIQLYVLLRREVDADPGRGGMQTHWEFFDSAPSGLAADRRAAFREITTAYEQARFSDATMPDTVATAVLDAVDLLTVPGDEATDDEEESR